uniref:Uncharacterized protein n=1 Tax=Rhizophora mucronata TaxID=61149 RepID=A0A2P2N5B1_RHIMU
MINYFHYCRMLDFESVIVSTSSSSIWLEIRYLITYFIRCFRFCLYSNLFSYF